VFRGRVDVVHSFLQLLEMFVKNGQLQDLQPFIDKMLHNLRRNVKRRMRKEATVEQ